MTDHLDAIAANKARWEEVVDVHLRSDGLEDGYDIAGAKAGTNRLTVIEEAELGPVDGLDVLHLQCHFGLDTLRLRRLGARVTGLDFSAKAIAAARVLFEDAGETGRFVEGDVYAAADLIQDRFDLVFVNWGAINWLPDIFAWARVVAACLRPGGRLYLCESHPAGLMFDHESDLGEMVRGRVALRFPYFHRPEPTVLEEADYADPDAQMANTVSHEWSHPISDILNALIQAGMNLEWLHEHDRIAWKLLPIMEKDEHRLFRLPPDFPIRVPLSLSLSARKSS
ncbi:MAG: class I SAM-dependent methyltransferase [Alphaproteobacteria bacterium]|nr:class I SAM-dependent methyltransferase [Alphaproteobacteria bacterium]